MGPEKGGDQLAVDRTRQRTQQRVLIIPRLLAVGPVAGSPFSLGLLAKCTAFSPAALLRAYEKLTERIDCMTREQRKQVRRWALYMGLLTMICLLLIAGLTA